MKLALQSVSIAELKSDSTRSTRALHLQHIQVISFVFILISNILISSCATINSLIGPPRASEDGSRSVQGSQDNSFIQAFLLESQLQKMSHEETERFFVIVNTPATGQRSDQTLYLPADAQALKASLRFQNNEAKISTIESGRLSQALVLNDGQCIKLENLHLKESKSRGLKEIQEQSKELDSKAKRKLLTAQFETNTANEQLLFLKIPQDQGSRRYFETESEFFVARPDPRGVVSCEELPENFVAGSSDGKFFEPAKKVQRNAAGHFLVELPPLAEVELEGMNGQTLQGNHLRIALKRDKRVWQTSQENIEVPRSWQSIQSVQDLSSSTEADAYYQSSFMVGSDMLRMKLPPGQYFISLTDLVTREVCMTEFKAIVQQKQVVSCSSSKGIFEEGLVTNQMGKAGQSRPQPEITSPKFQPFENLMLTIPTLVDSHPFAASLNRIFSRIYPQNVSALGRTYKQLQSREDILWPMSFGNVTLTKALAKSDSPNPEKELNRHSAVLTYASNEKTFLSQETADPGSSKFENSEQLVLDNVIYDFSDLTLDKNTELEAYLEGKQFPELAFLSNTSKAIDPLLLQTRLQYSSPSDLSTENVITSVTNGVLFKWNSPSVSSSLVHLPSDGLISLSVYIPPYNLTEYIEIYVGQKLYKRYIVERKNYKEPQIFRIEEYFDVIQDFQLTLYAWGKGYLPEYLFGQKGIRPRAIMSRLCFDVNKNSICDNSVSD